jgi:hypothetical protein
MRPFPIKLVINALLDAERSRHGLSDDNALALHLNVARKTLARWRAATNLGKTTPILLQLLIDHAPAILRQLGR